MLPPVTCSIFVEFNICGKTDVVALHSIASLVMAECARASLIFAVFIDVRPWFVWTLGI